MTKSRLIVLASIGGLFVWLFADALFGGGVFAFRDAGHYYYPLFQFVKSEWAAGRVPLWNPYENLGVPLAGNATSSVFYPGTLVFLLPLDYTRAYNLYVLGHVLLAAWTAYRLARHWGGSVEASGMGAISYAFSGNVLFQHCNVIFLVGAAWLPLAVLAADRMLVEGRGARREGPSARGRAAVLFGAVLALMTLGGNAEMAYHTGLIAAMYAVWMWWSERPPLPMGAGWSGGKKIRLVLSVRLAASRPAMLALAATTGLVLSAVQVFPAVELSRLSGRAASSTARSVYEIPVHALGGGPAFRSDGTGWADGLFCRDLDPGTHHQHAYHFSVGPWRLAEYVWPNFSGRQFPVHHRWLEVIPAEGRIWVPSLYMGLFPLLFALAALRLRKGDVRENWLSWLAVLSVAASFGWYGLGWLAHEIQIVAGSDPAGPWRVGSPVGGLYWLLTVLLPGYVYFRYPAKLLVIAALALSMLAVRGWDRAFTQPSRRMGHGWLGLAGVSLVGAMAVLATFPLRERWLGSVEPDVLFGPFDATGAYLDLLFAFLQTAVLGMTGWWLLRSAARGAWWPQAVALAIVAVDLAVANGWMLACAPAGEWRKRPKLAVVLREDEARRGDRGPYRVHRAPIWLPPSWRENSSPDRLTEAMRWDRDTLFPKYNLAEAIAVAEVQGTMKPYDYQVLVWLARSTEGGLVAGARAAPEARDPFSLATYLILPREERVQGMDRIPLEGTEAEGVDDVSLWRNPDHLPRAWIVHDVEVLPPLESNDPRDVWRRTRDVLYDARRPDGRRRNLRASAVVETDATVRPSSGTGLRTGFESIGVPAPSRESCRIVRDDPACVEIEAELERPGLVVLCDQFYPGWQLEVETAGQATRNVPILRTNRVMRGAWLEAGRHRLTYRYGPASFRWTAWVSGIGWIGLGLTFVCRGIRRHRRR